MLFGPANRSGTRRARSSFARAPEDNLPGFAAKVGGADRDRTDDLKLAKLALSQLSYGPDWERAGLPTEAAATVRSSFAKASEDNLRRCAAQVGGPGTS